MTKTYDHGTMTIVMTVVSKSQLKSHLLEYLRAVEEEKKPLIVTHVGKPVVKISPYHENPDQILASLRKSVVTYEDPTLPIGDKEWEALA